MPIPTEFEITFGCRHVGVIDLAELPADARAGRLAFLQDKGVCGDCFEATRAKRRELEQQRWVKDRRAEEAAEATEWSHREGYVPLTGSVKQVAFATRVRFDLMRELYGWAVEDGADPVAYERVEATAKNIDQARWWLDQRTIVGQSSDLIELLEAAGATHDGQACENTA